MTAEGDCSEFPYAIYYRVHVAQVWAVLDCRQAPRNVETRLT